MFYIYRKHIKSGREDFMKLFDTADAAIKHIAFCYKVDSGIGQLGDYYYFMKQR